MSTAVDLLLIGFGTAVAGLCVLIAYRVLTGAIDTAGLLYTTPGARSPDPDRVQALVVALAAIGYYVFIGFRAFAASPDAINSLPDAPNWVLAALGGSQLLYLSGKQARKIDQARNPTPDT